jgi:hypothetical protein
VDDRFAIPAATIQDLDLSLADPALAAEIRRLGALIEHGEETPEQFARIVELLVQAGHTQKAEYVLRRNQDVVANGPALYDQLFGRQKPTEFEAAIDAFRVQFGVRLQLVDSPGFLEAVYHSAPGPLASDRPILLGQACEVAFAYAQPHMIEAEVSCLADDAFLQLNWVNGKWSGSPIS